MTARSALGTVMFKACAGQRSLVPTVQREARLVTTRRHLMWVTSHSRMLRGTSPTNPAVAFTQNLLDEQVGDAGDPNVRQLEPDPRLAQTLGRAPRRGVRLILRHVRFRQSQEYENGAVERLHFLRCQ
jgi:hypothetical protein